ncbi:MAG TPA: phage holin family protein [Terriglobales bacterium]|nr:phage holin family protein [Terriglobales bacterium]
MTNEMAEGNHTRNLGVIVAELRDELKQFLSTRFEMLKAELHETVSSVRVAVPLGALALILLTTAFLLFSAAVVTLVASAFAGNPYAWFLGLIIVAVLWVILAGIAAFFAYNAFRSKSVFPKHTLEVLKADGNWLESEARTTYGRAA